MAQRLQQRTTFDLEMMAEIGFCQGIENYSRHLTGRMPGEPPPCLFDYLPPGPASDRLRSHLEHWSDSAYRGDYFTLGDVGHQDDDGYLYLTDRSANLIISGGVNIYPAEIEAALAMMPGVRDCAVFGIPDAEFGEALCAAVQAEADKEVSSQDVQDYLKKKLADYKVPKRVTFHDELPREESGKIFKRRLRAPYWEKAGRKI